MMSISEIKKSAKNSLKGYWGTVVISFLVYMLIAMITGFIPIVNLISMFVVVPAVAIGLNYQVFNLCIGNEISIKDIFSNSKLMIKSILLNFLLGACIVFMIIFLIILAAINEVLTGIASLILMLPLIHFSFRLSVIYFVMIDNEDMGVLDIIKETLRITKNNCLKIFCLDLSFIPLSILASLLLSIPCLWLFPYMLTSRAHLYFELKNKSNNI